MAKTNRRRFSPEFKTQVVLEVISGAKTQAEIARQHQIKPDIIARWRRQFLLNAASLFESGNRRNGATEARIAELEQALGKKTMELELAKKASSIFRQLSDEW